MELRLDSIRKKYGKHEALAGVSLHVRSGDCYGFLGHNGAGKTTALRIALGLIRPDAGRVIVDGFAADRHPREARARLGGLIETPGFYPWMSGRRNLRILGRLRGLDRAGARREADRLLEDVGLAAAADRKVGGYSQGMRQRLGIAQALLGGPPIVLLDEPTNGLDPEGIEEFRRLLRRLTAEEGRTVLLSSHQLKELADVCNRIGILRQGHLLVEGETEALTAAGGRRFELATDDADAAAAALAELGVGEVDRRDGRLLFSGGEVTPAAVAKALVARDLEVRELSNRRETLEDIYLRYARGNAPSAPATAPAPAAADAAPAAKRAPRFPVFRAFRQELSRTFSHPGPWIALLLPALLGVLSVVRLWASSEGHLKDVAGGEQFSHTLVTAFEGVAAGLRSALPLLAIVVAGLASQSLAGELSRGTLRNLLLTPVGRFRLALGKALGTISVSVAAYAVLLAGVVVASSIAFDFTDVVEILEIRTAEPWVSVHASELWGPFGKMLPSLAVPAAAYAAFGFLAGAITRRSVSGLSLAVGGWVGLEILRIPAAELGAERWLLSSYLPSPLADTSWTARMLDLIRAPNSEPGGFVDTALRVPALWLVAAVLFGAFVLTRRSVP